MLVHVVRDDEDVVVPAQPAHGLDLVPPEDLAERGVGVVEDECLGPGGEGGAELGRVEPPVAGRGDGGVRLGLVAIVAVAIWARFFTSIAACSFSWVLMSFDGILTLTYRYT